MPHQELSAVIAHPQRLSSVITFITLLLPSSHMYVRLVLGSAGRANYTSYLAANRNRKADSGSCKETTSVCDLTATLASHFWHIFL